MFVSVNPATGDEIARYDVLDAQSVDRRLEASWRYWQDWKVSPLARRARILERLADLLDASVERYALLITAEMGKPLREAESEVRKCAATARHFARAGGQYLAPEVTATEARLSSVGFEPLGPVLAIMPWNFPFWQVMRFLVPAILAGNVGLLKHAENVQACAIALEDLVAEAAGEPGLLVNLVVDRPDVGRLIADARIRAVTITGSVRAGREVASIAGAHGKKAVLELGGSDPFIVLADADLEHAVSVAVTSRFANAGQSCISAKRFIVDRAISEQFVEALTAGARRLVVGDPTDKGTTMGPMARQDLRDGFARQVQRSLDLGARAVVGGSVRPGRGYFFEPTVLVDVPLDCAAAQEELFGPAAAVFAVDTPDQAIALANSTSFGLGASLWTRDLDRAATLVDRIEAGAVFVNDLVRSDARLPFGGIKDSGYGRELGRLGIREFTNAKLRWVA